MTGSAYLGATLEVLEVYSVKVEATVNPMLVQFVRSAESSYCEIEKSENRDTVSLSLRFNMGNVKVQPTVDRDK